MNDLEAHLVCEHCGAESRPGYLAHSGACPNRSTLNGGLPHVYRPFEEVSEA